MGFNVRVVLPQSRMGLTAFCLLCISSLVASGATAWARPMLNDTSHFLLAQQVVDGLPPPPPGSVRAGSQQYLVMVDGDSQTLLSQVQQIQPSASVQEYNGQRFIQAGLFGDSSIAQQQVSNLAASGIGAQVVPVVSEAATVSQLPTDPSYGSADMNMLPPPQVLPTTSIPTSREVEFGTSDPLLAPPDNTNVPGSGRSYFVIVPGGGQDINEVSTQITRLTDGMGIDGMVQPGTARGSHVRVGPFNSRSAANRWSRYFRDFGMDARVSYSR